MVAITENLVRAPRDFVSIPTLVLLTQSLEVARRAKAEVFATSRERINVLVYSCAEELLEDVELALVPNIKHLSIDQFSGIASADLDALFRRIQPKVYSLFSLNDLNQLKKHVAMIQAA